ncbi:MAG: rhodanese-like domain-containing protein [Parcubacteria group bacterium]|jgi:rhodanese-related sulfurtransferase
MQIEKNKNLTAVAIGFFLMIAIAAITIYRSARPSENPVTDNAQNSPAAPEAPAKKSFELSTDELAAKLKTPQAPVVIDTRNPEEFQQTHILDAQNIPLEKIQQQLPALSSGQTYVIVDDGTSSGLSLATDVFPQNGFKNVFYLAGGFPEWMARNEPTISFGDPSSFTDQAKVNYVKSDQLKNMLTAKNELTIIDLRSSARFAEGHLPGAINILLSDLESQRARIPLGKKIILYDKDGLWAFQGSVRLFEMGFFNVFCLSDGLDGWQKNNYELVK